MQRTPANFQPEQMAGYTGNWRGSLPALPAVREVTPPDSEPAVPNESDPARVQICAARVPALDGEDKLEFGPITRKASILGWPNWGAADPLQVAFLAPGQATERILPCPGTELCSRYSECNW